MPQSSYLFPFQLLTRPQQQVWPPPAARRETFSPQLLTDYVTSLLKVFSSPALPTSSSDQRQSLYWKSEWMDFAFWHSLFVRFIRTFSEISRIIFKFNNLLIFVYLSFRNKIFCIFRKLHPHSLFTGTKFSNLTVNALIDCDIGSWHCIGIRGQIVHWALKLTCQLVINSLQLNAI